MPAASYFPAAEGGEWQRLTPAEAGMDGARLAEAVAFAEAHDSPWPRSLYMEDGRYVSVAESPETGPWAAIVGPVKPRGGPAGLLLKGGRIVAEWGDTARPDMTFSVTKSYLAMLAGVAVADGLIADVDEPVGRTVRTGHFESPHNARITWRHLLQQSSEWEGELWGKSERIDRNRQVGPGSDNSRKGQHRDLQAPGSFYEYNDVRVNLLSHCLMHRFGRPLPEVLAERIMAPIGASGGWEWHGYDTSTETVGGRRLHGVSGGGHWGGGLVISARDLARVGLMVAGGGAWGGKQVLSPDWVRAMLTPSPTHEGYGYLWWLNRGRGRYSAAPESNVFALGAGNNMIWLDPEHDMVVVLRWIDKTAVGGFLQRTMAALG
jgi:CubicO group peptidase (beta-lactamase class C family)